MTTNDNRLSDLMSDVREMGREMQAGKDSLPNLALKVARAVEDGVISTEKDKDGVDDAQRVYGEFVKAASKKAVHEHTTSGVKANTSKLRQIMLAASKPTLQNGFYDALKRVVEARKAAIAKEEKVQGAYPAFVAAARLQVEQDDDLTDAQIGELIKKPEAEAPDLEKMLEAVHKKLSNIVEGKDGVKCTDPEVVQARELIGSKLAALIVQRETNETLEKAAALGLTLAVQPAAQAA